MGALLPSVWAVIPCHSLCHGLGSTSTASSVIAPAAPGASLLPEVPGRVVHRVGLYLPLGCAVKVGKLQCF